ncbi:group III truncated hemoglobin [Gramella lutea]|uniref:Group III truncated hemoglobin n=1 Tax=Christiangramia lutea TaxID=1607951 RepID=A0A9X2ACG5_9FLAO|nr:group III truncated hemoglobin [Christiangramia lutea]MCH4824457.1 group III truncated hemoglobin [Christiangramia lutea]
MKEDLKDRADLKRLVINFYTKVRKDKEIGYFFNNSIKNWEQHFEKLTDFWESNLFFTGSFKGNPALAHIKVDSDHDNSISEYHFGIWLNLWFQSIDELYSGELAERLKQNARKMSTHLFLRIYQSRQAKKI